MARGSFPHVETWPIGRFSTGIIIRRYTGIFLYSYEAEFTQSLLSTGMKRLASQFIFIYGYIDDVLSINNPDFENYLGQMYPLSLSWKTRRRATFLLRIPTWIYSCQSARTINFALPFTTCVMIQFPYYKHSVPEKQQSIFASL